MFARSQDRSAALAPRHRFAAHVDALPRESVAPRDSATDAGALDAWILRHQLRPWRYLRACGCAPDLADDLLQDGLLAALHKRVPELADAEAAAWLLGAVRNLWRAHLREMGVHQRAIAARAELADRALAQCAHDDDGAAFQAALHECLAVLDGRARIAIELRYRDAASRERMAERLGLSHDGVKTLLRRTREFLRACVERRIGDRAEERA